MNDENEKPHNFPLIIQCMLLNDWQKCTKNQKFNQKKKVEPKILKKRINNEKIEYNGLWPMCDASVFPNARFYFVFSSFFNSSFQFVLSFIE